METEQEIDIGKLSDREILVKLATTTTLNFAAVRKDIKELRDGTQKTIDDHETRLRTVEEKYVTKEDHTALGKLVEEIKGRIIYIFAWASAAAAIISFAMYWFVEIKKN